MNRKPFRQNAHYLKSWGTVFAFHAFFPPFTLNMNKNAFTMYVTMTFKTQSTQKESQLLYNTCKDTFPPGSPISPFTPVTPVSPYKCENKVR